MPYTPRMERRADHDHSLAECVDRGLNMLICHEGIFLPPQTSPWYDAPKPEHIHANIACRALLDEHELVVYRSHSNWDALVDDGVRDQAIAALGIEGLKTIAQRKFFSILELPTPTTVAGLLGTVSTGLGYPDCRAFGDITKSIRWFSFLIGGFGENQHRMPQVARDLGAEAIIIGEMSTGPANERCAGTHICSMAMDSRQSAPSCLVREDRSLES